MELPEDMDIPQMRRDTTKEANVRWLLRNIAVRNTRHPEFPRVCAELGEEMRKFYPNA